MGGHAFSDNKLTTVAIPDSVTSLEGGAFSGNQITQLPSYFSNPWVTELPDSIFASNNFTDLVIPANITNISGSAFSDNKLATLTLGNSVQSIGWRAFHGNYLTSLTIPASVEHVEGYAFAYNSLTQVAVLGNPDISGNYPFVFNGLDRHQLPSDFYPTYPGGSDLEMQRKVFKYYADNADVVAIFAVNPMFTQAMRYAELVTVCTQAIPLIPGSSKTSVPAAPNPWTGEEDPDCFYASAYILNPTPLMVTYRDIKTNNLLATKRFTGQLADGTYLTDYKIHAIAELPYDPDTGLDVYFRAGQTITMTPPAIDGWQTPEPFTITTVQAMSLQDNHIPFIYRTAGAPLPNNTTPDAPDSGVGNSQTAILLAITAVVGMVLGGAAVVRWSLRP